MLNSCSSRGVWWATGCGIIFYRYRELVGGGVVQSEVWKGATRQDLGRKRLETHSEGIRQAAHQKRISSWIHYVLKDFFQVTLSPWLWKRVRERMRNPYRPSLPACSLAIQGKPCLLMADTAGHHKCFNKADKWWSIKFQRSPWYGRLGEKKAMRTHLISQSDKNPYDNYDIICLSWWWWYHRTMISWILLNDIMSLSWY